MKRLVILLCAAAAGLIMTSMACASIGDFVADSDQFGYGGIVTDVTQSNSSYSVPTPRDASVYFNHGSDPLGYSAYGNNNEIMSNWYQSPESNQTPGFFQIADYGAMTVTSATCVWTQESGGLWDFTLSVAGKNATYANSAARLWQPDIPDSYGGNFTGFAYTLTATGMDTTVTGGWRVNTDNPTGITGSFVGTFVNTYASDSNPNGTGIGDTYSAQVTFDMAAFDRTDWNTQYPEYGYGAPYSTFAAPVPEPATMLVWGLLGLVAGVYGVRRRRAR
jgi:hypothetical protein